MLLSFLPWVNSGSYSAVAPWQRPLSTSCPIQDNIAFLNTQEKTKMNTLHAAELCLRGETAVSEHIAPVNEHIWKRSLCCRGAVYTLIVNFVKVSEHLVQRPAHESSSSSSAQVGGTTVPRILHTFLGLLANIKCSMPACRRSRTPRRMRAAFFHSSSSISAFLKHCIGTPPIAASCHGPRISSCDHETC